MLSRRHQQFLTDRAVTPEIAARRGYATADEAMLMAAGFSRGEAQKYKRGLLIPRYGLGGKPSWPKVRPDVEGRNGPVQNRNGHVIKYASPGGSWNFVDALPGSTPFQGDEIWVSAEGFIKGDAMAGVGLPVVSIDGVYGWRSQKEIVPGFPALCRDRRWFHLVCDSDFTDNPAVAMALLRLAETLREMGAAARILHPPGEEKVGVDDFLAAGGSIGGLVLVQERDAWRRARNQSRCLRALNLLRSTSDEPARRPSRFTH